jgi:predicted SAM-dependent methyltransferase
MRTQIIISRILFLVFRVFRFFVLKPIRTIENVFNRYGNVKRCYICQNTFYHFTKFRKGSKDLSEFLISKKTVGSDLDNFGCPVCGSHDRERHLFMFFDKLNFWEGFTGARILHFAPEKKLAERISVICKNEYVKADLSPQDNTVKKVDVTNINYTNDYFDFVICNHVLEHVEDYLLALREIIRVLKPGGIAILQTPYSKSLEANFEDKSLQTSHERVYYYGQEDHVRLFSEKQLLNDLKNVGFILDVIKNSDFFNEHECWYYGINAQEDLIKVIKS